MLQLILHGIGDYFLQTDYQALNKKKPGIEGFLACLKHCTTYSLPFLLLGSWQAVVMIFLTHFAIDRTNFVAYLLAIKNGVKKYQRIDQNGYLMDVSVDTVTYWKAEGVTLKEKYDISNFGFGLGRPFAITIWLYIICDNILHIICNYIALRYF